MPELPEVEVVRRGVADHVVGRRFTRAQVSGVRTARRHLAGAADLSARLTDRYVDSAQRRGKYLWLTLDEGDEALVVHLGMSGQLLVEAPDAPVEKHAHAVFDLSDGQQLRFVDQRTFGGLQLTPVVSSDVDGRAVPEPVAHIAADPLESGFDRAATVRAIRRRRTQLKRALLDQSLVSGIGNIYADEALWAARLNGLRATDRLPAAKVSEVLDAATGVMHAALAQGGTSFDALYVNVNGASGYFDRSLHAYGQQGRACARCGTLIVREQFMNRSSHFCPTCQPRPRSVRPAGRTRVTP
ncbi:DNA-(apurinic or apyrimidinic site) lyase [Branchiibius hedensis]|uniref:Formamidopyrimidine-DNA glycosylase n=1 Tax=Branchiibius hedensis TaxID=672460 RepID=A0A2Y8ZS71_9MICO|nr:bifunctional DNA-formamidopyrimidine glycosylase/DNA-(apurinic or apyrimidinic site) lyase [Branchiibius hedensis]PWJ25922.1 DNA-(apurinic or apyrimidinic site) lyase [Branchiibius hedensis]SSA34735.1 DNA-(apurinic or apyrimidinic site) lyase [Branchiibius hedensis]